MDARIEETIKNLKRRGFEPYYLESRAQVLPLVQKLVPAGSSVSHGGSETLKEVGVIDLLSGGDYQYINRPDWRARRCANATRMPLAVTPISLLPMPLPPMGCFIMWTATPTGWPVLCLVPAR